MEEREKGREGGMDGWNDERGSRISNHTPASHKICRKRVQGVPEKMKSCWFWESCGVFLFKLTDWQQGPVWSPNKWLDHEKPPQDGGKPSRTINPKDS